MSFPLNLGVDLFIDGAYVDVTSDVVGMSEGNAISITYGAPDERSQASPSTVQFTLKNFADAASGRVAGQYSTDNPRSPYFGKLVQNTLCRIRIGATTIKVARISTWTPTADNTGRLLLMQVNAQGALALVNQGGRARESALRRNITYRASVLAHVIGYWPMEEEAGSTSIASGLNAGKPADTSGTFNFATDSDLAGSDPLPKPSINAFFGSVVSFPSSWTSDDGWGISWVMRLPSAPGSTITLMKWWPNNFGYQGRVVLTSGSLTKIQLFDASGTELLGDVGNTYVVPYGDWAVFCLTADSFPGPVGTLYELSIFYKAPDGSIAANSYGVLHVGPVPVSLLSIQYQAPMADISIGHFMVANNASIIDPTVAFGYIEERAFTRIQRICSEQSIPFTGHTLLFDDSPLMGEQQRGKSATELMLDAANADGGILYEDSGSEGLVYTTRSRLYNQAPVLNLDYSLNHISDPFDPTKDDQNIENRVTVRRVGGSSATASLASGPMSTLDPPDGVGVYDRGGYDLNVLSDTQVSSIAWWKVGLGTNPAQQVRLPALGLELSRPVWSSNAALTAQATALGVGSALTLDGLVNTRPDLPPDMMALQVRGGSMMLAQYQQDLIFNLTSGWHWEVWQLETGGSTVVAPVASNGTSLKLATSIGPEWSISKTPYHIQASGNAMTVTAMNLDTPAFIASGTVANGNNASVVPGLPAGMTPDVGQVLLVFAAIRNSGAGTPNTPAGYSNVFASANMAVFGRYYVTGDTAPTVSFTGGVANADTTARILGFSGLSLHLDGTPATQLNGSAQNIAYPYLLNRRANEVTFIYGWKQDDWTSVATLSGMTEAVDNATTTGDDQGIVVDYLIQGSIPADVLPGSFVVTGGANAISRVGVFSLRPLQTATVTRNINGISTSIAAGAAVKGWRLGVIAL